MSDATFLVLFLLTLGSIGISVVSVASAILVWFQIQQSDAALKQVSQACTHYANRSEESFRTISSRLEVDSDRLGYLQNQLNSHEGALERLMEGFDDGENWKFRH